MRIQVYLSSMIQQVKVARKKCRYGSTVFDETKVKN